VEDLHDDQLPSAVGVGEVGDRPGRRHEDVAFPDGVGPPLAVLDGRHHSLTCQERAWLSNKSAIYYRKEPVLC
jgi:hypothetical protein